VGVVDVADVADVAVPDMAMMSPSGRPLMMKLSGSTGIPPEVG
jgi:hypothetical protein